MAKRKRKPAFVPITFKSLEELNDFGETVSNESGWPLADYEFNELFQRFFSKAGQQLRTWAKARKLSICDDGTTKILDNTDAGSWKEYFRRNWDEEETRCWFRDHIRLLTGKRTFPRDLSIYGGWNTPWATFDTTLTALGKVRWAKWPFGRAPRRPSQKKGRKK